MLCQHKQYKQSTETGGLRAGLKDGLNRASLKDMCRKYMAFNRKPWEGHHAPAELLTGSSRKDISAIKG